MRINTMIIPRDWVCEACHSKGVSTSPRKVNQNIGSWVSRRQQAVKTGKVKFLPEDEVIRLSFRKACVGSKNVISKIPSLTPKSNPHISPPKVRGKPPRNNEIHKKPMTNQHASCSLSKGPPKENIPTEKVQSHDPQKVKPSKGAPFEALSARKSSLIVSSGGIPCADAQCNQSNIEKSDLQSIQEDLNFHRKFLPSSIPTWRGQFQILQTAASSEFYDGFEALPPCIVNRKAYKFSTQMPSVLQLELLPALNVLTDVFQDDSPKLQDIALYFIPLEHSERSKKNLYSILKFMNAEKSMLRSYIDGVELLVFTSNQLDMDSKGVVAAVNTGYFLWGIFRHNKIDKAIEREPDMEPVDMDIDVIRGEDVVGRVGHVRKDKPKSVSVMEYYVKLNVSPGFEALA
ncbi:hypothetical protein E2542_SST02062 [Spatholobus suberectus]|nr:hypothetical protein E2542_SST02062 [Spatholobus suberectus]